MLSNLALLWQSATHVVNLPYTLLLGLVVAYWIITMFGAIDVEALDFDTPDAEGDIGGGHTGFEGLLEYFNLRKVPVSVYVSLFAVSLWLVGVLANHYLHNTSSRLLGLVVFVGNVIVSSHAAKFLTLPLVPLFQSMRGEESAGCDLVGTRVVVTSSKADAAFGQAEVQAVGAPITLSVRTDGEVLPKGTGRIAVLSLFLNEPGTGN